MNNNTNKTGSFLLGKVAGKVDFCKLLGLSGLIFALANIPEYGHAVVAPNTLPSGFSSPTANVSFTKIGNTLNVSSNANKSVANYQTFSIGSGAAVKFNLPSSNAAILNRVLGPNASEIYGSMSSNGKVFLINPNGVLFGPSAKVNVNSLVTSTLGMDDQDFIAGKYKFVQKGAPKGIVNQGTITTAAGGVAALIGGAVRNDGTINTPSGATRLVAGQEVTLDFGEGVNAKVTIDKALESKVAGFSDAILNNGVITADAGSIKAQAYATSSLYDTLVNNKGLMQANGLITRHGEIELTGFTDDCTGVVANSGNLIATRNDSYDGLVQLLANKLELTDGAIKARATSLFSTEGFNIGTSVDTRELRLRTLGGITQTAPIIRADRTSIIAGGSVDLTDPLNNFGDFAANITGEGAHLYVSELNNIKVNDVDGLMGIVTNNGDVKITANKNIELDDIINTGSGDIYLTAGDSIRQNSRLISGDEIFLNAPNIYGSGNLDGYFLTDSNSLTSSVDFKGVTVDQIENGFDLGSKTFTRKVKVGEYTEVIPPTVTTNPNTPTAPTPSVNVNDGEFIAYLESLVNAGVSGGQTSGSASGGSANMNDTLFRQIINDFRNNINQNGTGNAVDVNGNFTYSFKLLDGRTVKVTGSFAEFMRLAGNGSETQGGTRTVGIYEDQPYVVNFTDRALSQIKASKSDEGKGIGIRTQVEDMTCKDCQVKFVADAEKINRDFTNRSTNERTQEQAKLDEYNNRYNFEWEVLPAETPATPVVNTPTISERPLLTPTPGLPEGLNSIHDLTPKLISSATFTNGVVSMLPGAGTPVVGAPVFYQPEGVASVPASPAVPSTQLAEEGPAIAAPQFYMPEAPAPVEEAPNVAQPVFYHPGLW